MNVKNEYNELKSLEKPYIFPSLKVQDKIKSICEIYGVISLCDLAIKKGKEFYNLIYSLSMIRYKSTELNGILSLDDIENQQLMVLGRVNYLWA